MTSSHHAGLLVRPYDHFLNEFVELHCAPPIHVHLPYDVPGPAWPFEHANFHKQPIHFLQVQVVVVTPVELDVGMSDGVIQLCSDFEFAFISDAHLADLVKCCPEGCLLLWCQVSFGDEARHGWVVPARLARGRVVPVSPSSCRILSSLPLGLRRLSRNLPRHTCPRSHLLPDIADVVL